MVGTLFKREADLIVTSLTVTAERANAVKYLLPIAQETMGFIVAKASMSNAVAWSTFVVPFSAELWTTMVAAALFCAMILAALRWHYLPKLASYCKGEGRFSSFSDKVSDWTAYVWITFCAYFGGAPRRMRGDDGTAMKILLFLVCLAGNVIFMSYRAAMTSELSVRRDKLPFTNLEELMASRFRYENTLLPRPSQFGR